MYDNPSAQALRAVLDQRPHSWCPQYGWHDDCPAATDCTQH